MRAKALLAAAAATVALTVPSGATAAEGDTLELNLPALAPVCSLVQASPLLKSALLNLNLRVCVAQQD